MKRATFFVTGTDTGVGKTLVTALLASHWRRAGHRVAAVKPVCSGSRDDARLLRKAGGHVLTLDEVNPWSFRAPLAPRLASRLENRLLRKRDVLAYLRGTHRRFPFLLVEGAGGLRSPLGENFDSRDLLLALGAIPLVVCPNRLGAVNQCLLVLDALPGKVAARAQVVLVSPPRASRASRTNPRLLGEFIGAGRLHVFPWLKDPRRACCGPAPASLRRFLEAFDRSNLL